MTIPEALVRIKKKAHTGLGSRIGRGTLVRLNTMQWRENLTTSRSSIPPVQGREPDVVHW